MKPRRQLPPLPPLLLLALLVAAAPTRRLEAADESSYTLTADHLAVERRDSVEVAIFEGNVVFRSGPTLLRSDRGEFDGSRSAGTFTGDVELFHEDALFLGPVALVFEADERIEFPSGVIVLQRGRTLLAERGRFDTAGESGTLHDEVRVLEGNRALEADTLDFLAENEAIARGRVVMRDLVENLRVTGAEARLGSDRTLVLGRPTLLRFDERGEIESKVIADTLVFDEEGAVDAFGAVRVEQKATVGEGATARIEQDGKQATLEGSPRITREGRTLSGERLVLALQEGKVREVLATGDARLVREERIEEEGSEPEIASDVVVGESLRMEVEADTLRRAVVWGGIRSTTERRTLDGAIAERNEVSGDSLILYTDAGEVNRIVVIGGAEGRYLPRSETPRPGAADTTAGRSAAAADSGAAVDPASSEDRVVYSGEQVEFFTKTRRILLTGSASLEYQQMHLDAQRVLYELDRAALTAEGEPKLQQAAETVTGARMGFNLDEQRGIVYEGETTYDNGRLRGGEVCRIDGKTLDVRNGIYTSCDQDPPHYHFSSRLMRVYLDDKSVARPVVFYIQEIPVLALPFYMLPLNRGRHSGFLLPDIEFGINDRRGRFIRNLGYYWATSDYLDFAGWADIYQNQRWTAHLVSNYAIRYLLSGNVRGSYSRETPVGGGGRRWDIEASHRQELGERATLTARADFVSDATYRTDQALEVEDLNRELKSDITLQKNWSNQSISLFASRLEKLDRNETTEQLPKLSYSRQRFPIFGGGSSGSGSAPWYGTTYLSVRGELVNSRVTTEKDSTGADSLLVRFATEETFSLSNSMKLFGWLGLSPSATYREAIFNKDNFGHEWRRRGVWSASASANTTLYGTWRPNIGPLTGLRHIMAPSVGVSYSPDFDDLQGKFPSVSGIGGTPGGSQSLRLGVQHTFQAKLRSGEEERSVSDLLIINQSISRNLKGPPKGWSDLSSSIRLRPASRYDVNVSTTHDLYDLKIKNTRIQNELSLDGTAFGRGRGGGQAPQAGAADEGLELDTEPSAEDILLPRGQASRGGYGGPWRLNVSHSYSKSRGGRPDQRISARLSTDLSRNWHFDYAPFYDLRMKEVISQDFTFVRDLHCWEARFRGRYNGRDWEYFFKINIRSHPDVGYERGRQNLRSFGSVF